MVLHDWSRLGYKRHGGKRGRIALVVGAEKMTALPTGDVGNVLLCASYHKEEARPAGFAGIFAGIVSKSRLPLA